MRQQGRGSAAKEGRVPQNARNSGKKHLLNKTLKPLPIGHGRHHNF